MNTKTSLKRVYNYYNGTEHGVGRDSPGALLDMLAEVASQTLHSEKKWTESSSGIQMKSQSKLDSVKRRSNNQEPSYTSAQLLSMPASQLVKQFSIFTGDELKRQYSYTCALVPGCSQKYTSFASEGRARMSIKAHLADHLDYLKRDEEAYSAFTAVAVKHKNLKPSPGAKKPRGNQQKKPVEVLNKENKDTKSGKSTNYLRKILSNEMDFTEFEKQKTLDNIIPNNNEDRIEIKKEPPDQLPQFKVLDDHSYYGQAKDDTSKDKGNSDLGDIMVNEAMGENIMLMVVESDGVHMKELPYIAQDISVRTEQNEVEAIYLPDSVSWSEEAHIKNMEISVPAKPKGKAKFIGTSKEEREMALALMERIKRKGNPGGGNLQCRICDPPRSFTAPTTLVSHYRSHAGIKPYECRICRAVFTRRHSLKYHMLIHQNQTRFTCADCGKKFRHPSHFREHRRRHTGEAPFGCEDCGQRFKTRNTYKRHLKTRHGKVLTTTGELLHLSEEDFQKVRTNPKRRAETHYTESMIDEDIMAPEVIIQLQNQDCSNDVENDEIKQETVGNYRSLIEEKDDNSNESWENANGANGESEINQDVNEVRYRDYEYFDESQVNKTDYTKTDKVSVDNCEFRNIENVVDHLEYTEGRGNDEETVDNDCISTAIQDESDIQELELLGNEETAFDESLDHQEEILYAEDLNDEKKSNLIEYVEGIHVTECIEDVLAYDDSVGTLQEEEEEDDFQLVDTEEQTEADYFDSNINTATAIEFKEVELNMERYEEINDVGDRNDSLQSAIQDPLESQEFISCHLQNESIAEENTGESDTEILQQNNSGDSRNDFVQETSEHRYLLDESHVVLEEDTLKTEYPKRFLFQEDSLRSNDKTSRANVAVEHIVQYPMTNYQAEENQTIHNTPHIYLQTNPSSNIIIKNKDLVGLLSQRMKLQQNPDKLELPKSSGKVVRLLNRQPQSFNLVQNGKQGTILLLASSNEMKNNYSKLDSNNGVVVSGMKTLPVIAVQQKIQ